MLNHAQLSRTDINLLLVFDLLIEERNAGRAAARLNLSPSAVSHALRRLRAMFDDPLFIASPRGMVPTDRARRLAPAIRDIVERVHGVLASVGGFDPATASRRFRVGAPDGAVSILVPPLVERIETRAPGVDLAVLQILPRPGAPDPDHAWGDALADVESGRIDLTILPHRPPSGRFHAARLYSEDFAFAVRDGHTLANAPTIEAIAAARHLLVSATGDASGFVDALLAQHGHERRVALTVPSFFMAAAAIAASDLVGALPRHFAREAMRNYPLRIVEPPFSMGSADLHAIVPAAAMLDHGIAWLMQEIAQVAAALD